MNSAVVECILLGVRMAWRPSRLAQRKHSPRQARKADANVGDALSYVLKVHPPWCLKCTSPLRTFATSLSLWTLPSVWWIAVLAAIRYLEDELAHDVHIQRAETPGAVDVPIVLQTGQQPRSAMDLGEADVIRLAPQGTLHSSSLASASAFLKNCFVCVSEGLAVGDGRHDSCCMKPPWS
eukprot:6224183-Amphidinium_carterae.1